jgi:two-component system sensor histidine kinase UhpB
MTRKKAEAALTQSAERFRQIAENVSDFLWEVDAKGLYTYASPSVEKILGYTCSDLVGKMHFYDLFAPAVRAELKAAAFRVFEAKQAFRAFPNPNVSKDGRVVDLETSGVPFLNESGDLVGYRGADTDITERKRTEEELRKSEERLRLTLEANSEGVWDWDIPSGKAFFSPRYSGMLGYEPEEFPKDYAGWKELVHPEDFERVDQAHAAHIHERKQFCVEFRMRKKTGDWCWIRSRGTVIERDAEDRAIRMVGTHLDITERKRAEMALRESEETSRTTFEQAAVGIAHVGTDGRWLRVNDKLCAILGYPREELMQLTFQDITYPEDLDKDLNYVRQVLSGEINTYSNEKRYIRKDRSLVWANLTVSLVRNDAGEPKHLISVVEDITRRKQAEVELRELSGRLIKAQEKERAWLAKELHDGLSQNLALLAIELDQLAQHPPENPAQVSVRMEAVSARVKELAEDVHHLSHGLHPSILEHVGLAAALKGFCRELEHSRSVAVHFTARDVPNMLPKEVSLCLYRVAQEALQNVAKHSGAKQATVEVRVAGDEIHMRIADDGKGFDLLSQTTTDSIGLVGMRERIGLVHGEIRWDTQPGQGTTVDVCVPFQASVMAA